MLLTKCPGGASISARPAIKTQGRGKYRKEPAIDQKFYNPLSGFVKSPSGHGRHAQLLRRKPASCPQTLTSGSVGSPHLKRFIFEMPCESFNKVSPVEWARRFLPAAKRLFQAFIVPIGLFYFFRTKPLRDFGVPIAAPACGERAEFAFAAHSGRGAILKTVSFMTILSKRQTPFAARCLGPGKSRPPDFAAKR